MGRENNEGPAAVENNPQHAASEDTAKRALSADSKVNVVEEGLRNADNLQKKSGKGEADTTKMTLKQVLAMNQGRAQNPADNDNYKENMNVPEDSSPPSGAALRENVGSKDSPDGVESQETNPAVNPGVANPNEDGPVEEPAPAISADLVSREVKPPRVLEREIELINNILSYD